MKNNNIKISCVSYLNSKPFIYGLENSTLIQQGQVELSLDIPRRCAEKLLNNEADIGLVPVASLPLIGNYNIISNYCIGANGKVHSVNLYSDVPLHEIDNIILDYQSLTSINLTKILCKEFWKINPKFIDADKDFISNIDGKTAGVIIGDRTFNIENKFKYVYDLAEQWQLFTKLPFVFAVWVANKKVDDYFLNEFENCLQIGIQNIDKVAEMYKIQYAPYDVFKYLNTYINYDFDQNKQNALHIYLTYLKNL
jgi:chorismate dehydratase